MSSPPRVLVLGAGLGGLLLAQCLRKKSIPCTVFERDQSLDSRTQGWSVGLHSFFDDLSSSLPSDLPSINTTSHLLPLDVPAQACMYLPHAPKLHVISTPSQPIVRANRQKLRDWLATHIDVQFNKKTTSIAQSDSGEITLTFSDGTSATGDLLVGADGVHSYVRSYLLDDPHHTHLSDVPVGVIVADVTLSKESYERQLTLGHSACIVFGDDFHMFVGLQSIAEDAQSAKYYWFVIWEGQHDAGKDGYWTKKASKKELYDYAVEKTKGLDPKFTEIVRETTPEGVLLPPLVIRDMVLKKGDLPGREGRGKGRIVLLGDAAHPMTPFRGEGACHAMIDALNLAKAIGGDEDGLVERLRLYQEEMLERGADAVLKSRGATSNEQESGERVVWGQNVRPAEE